MGSRSPRIAIVGKGALGLLYGSRAARALAEGGVGPGVGERRPDAIGDVPDPFVVLLQRVARRGGVVDGPPPGQVVPQSLELRKQPPRQYVLNPSRRYECRGEIWQEERYDPLRFDRDRFLALLHEGDRQFRKFLKTGHYLREKREEAWAAPYAAALIAAEEKAVREAARPKINIDFTDLDRIRRDAGVTRDSLLTEEELAESSIEPEPTEPAFDGLDAQHLQILLKLLRGESAAELIQNARLMPAVAADTINEAFYDEIGDSVVEYDGSALMLVEDYREDLTRKLGGTQT